MNSGRVIIRLLAAFLPLWWGGVGMVAYAGCLDGTPKTLSILSCPGEVPIFSLEYLESLAVCKEAGIKEYLSIQKEIESQADYYSEDDGLFLRSYAEAYPFDAVYGDNRMWEGEVDLEWELLRRGVVENRKKHESLRYEQQSAMYAVQAKRNDSVSRVRRLFFQALQQKARVLGINDALVYWKALLDRKKILHEKELILVSEVNQTQEKIDRLEMDAANAARQEKKHLLALARIVGMKDIPSIAFNESSPPPVSLTEMEDTLGSSGQLKSLDSLRRSIWAKPVKSSLARLSLFSGYGFRGYEEGDFEDGIHVGVRFETPIEICNLAKIRKRELRHQDMQLVYRMQQEKEKMIVAMEDAYCRYRQAQDSIELLQNRLTNLDEEIRKIKLILESPLPEIRISEMDLLQNRVQRALLAADKRILQWQVWEYYFEVIQYMPEKK